MSEQLLIMLAFMESSGTLAPFMFVLFHVIRQFMFIPVALVCIAGGILFGSFLGTLYSMGGLLLLSAVFYFCIGKMPGTHAKLMKIKYKWFGRYTKMTVGQIAVLRLIPFFHYQLLNICLLERRPDFKGFMKGAFATNLPLAFFYTVFGEFITHFTPGMATIIILSLCLLFYLLREKIVIVTWEEFFSHQKEQSKNPC
ncbi:TVP38/TMEM64 family protein [Lederbergia lenta]|uniref:SNARE associated Golgi protein-like protein n=1 Tax=Lederbergia lenta TaxID=1467 RepID=A0A2X4Z2Y0_LEDLE|nr:VTT domain-containing protein [Lederbergia lenta]MCM3111151.1 VTT domain-containing protein [Lederbergia lenta]MEC2325461.1 VTT domain-containing protein [Lederbergia lenta]SQI55004.1 SNARE associated Golgi protein-like protein [Lederbergia lenta]